MTADVADKLQNVDQDSLESQVKDMYTKVAEEPHEEYHFEMGRGLTERLGYAPEDLDSIPAEAIDSFAGVGYYFHLALLKPGETVVDLGMTDAQLDKASALRDRDGFANVEYRKSYIEDLPVADASVDTVISNGVINLSPDKPAVFREVARILKPGGRLAIADIVTQSQLPETVSCNADLWAACIGGAMQIDEYCAAIEAAGLAVTTTQANDKYGFISDNAMGATEKWGVHSISLLAVKKG
jgi:SAM-dependent methyltransferase